MAGRWKANGLQERTESKPGRAGGRGDRGGRRGGGGGKEGGLEEKDIESHRRE